MKEIKERRKKLLRAGKENNIGAFLISGYENIYYFSGFRILDAGERAAFLLVSDCTVYLFSDGRYLDDNIIDKLPRGINGVVLSGKNKLNKILHEIAGKEKIKVLGFEAADLRTEEYLRFRAGLACRLEAADRLIQKLRAIKSTGEILQIKNACLTIDRCLKELIPSITEGETGKAITARLEYWLRQNADGPAFSPIVAIDSDSSLPHFDSRQGTRQVKYGSLILIDCGAEVGGYRSDITRMFFYKHIAADYGKVYRDLLLAQEKTIAFLNRKQNKFLAEADNFCRSLLAQNNYPLYPHSLGHGIGLQTHEQPRLSVNSSDRLESSQVFTVEPGIYFPGRFGMRIEDTVTVDKNGNIQGLTKYPKTIAMLNKK